MSVSKAVFGEFLGTFIFFSVIVVASETFGTAHGCLLPIAVAIGLLAALLIAAPISGGHLNPAVSFMSMLKEPNNGVKFGLYILAQLAAAICVFFLINRWYLRA